MRRLLSSILAIMSVSCLFSQEIEKKLEAAGFENVLIREKDSTRQIFFEYREFRNPYHSIKLAEKILDPNLDELDHIENVWIPLYHNQPLGANSGEDYSFYKLEEDAKNFYNLNNRSFSNYRFHIRVHPEVVSRFGYYSDPFETKFNMILDTRIYLARGLSLQTGITIPVVNNLDNHGMKLRAAPTMLHYFNQPWDSHFFSFSVGTFYSGRYGLDMEYRYADLQSPWSFGFAGGLTGFYRLYGLEYYSEPMDNIYAVADVEWRTGIENTSLKLSAGQFLFKDKGVRLGLIKQFEAAEIGLFAAHTDIGTTGGFQFAFSLWPGKILRTENFELRTTEEFRWEYSYNGFDPVARQYRIGMPRLSNLLRNYNEAWVSNLQMNK